MSSKNLTQIQKYELLEQAVFKEAPEEISKLYKSLGEIKFTSRALGIACRFRGLETVQALVRCGAGFCFDAKEVKKGFKDAGGNSETFYITENYFPALIEFLNLSHMRELYGAGNSRGLKLLPLKERLEILDYLFENAHRTGFKPDVFMFFAIIGDEQEMIAFLKSKGVRVSEEWAEIASKGGSMAKWYDYGVMLRTIGDDRFIPVLKQLISEIGEVNGNNRLHFTEWFWQLHKDRFLKPRFFEFLLESFNQAKMKKCALMKELIDLDNVSCLEIAVNNNWLKLPKMRDEMIKYAVDNKKTECAAFLLDFKNRTADLKAENEKAEKKAQRELNANPHSLSSLKKSWSYKKKEDGTLIITGYKGSSTVIEVPQKIGGDKVTEIDDWAFSPYAARIKEPSRQFRRTITKITLPDGIIKIGESAFRELSSLESVNIPESVRSIGENAFSDCYMLKSAVVPEGVRDIGDNAFSMLDGRGELEYVELPSTLNIFSEDCRWWRPYLFHSKNSPKLVVAVPHAPHVEEFCEHNKIKFVYKENK